MATAQQQPWANPNGTPTPVVSEISDAEAISVLMEPYSTLEEPVMETIMRDVRAVVSKLKVVMLPLDRNVHPFGYMAASTTEQEQVEQPELGENQRKVIEQLKDWDLWGPLVVGLGLSIILSWRAPNNQAALVFASVFVTVWVGSAIVTVNAQLLGGTISFFQSLCVLGYCNFPMTMAALVIGLVKLTPMKHWVWLDLIWLGLGWLWATRASSVFIAMYIPASRRFLATYPVLFFYVFLGW
eukprot:CAMPEP_0194047642 /NCGR_PEP_ID=MMETSP0009_2-20130614/25091_1 /TAXON_ID=210454 /ORGANISM="Grammatophora oceanica, Strain CCMP 410" /LENGTH=240 /DNA_ID=CAMNT_0038693311 /DNA_START=25 /DNA_END=744 /DNA_ORIENTATION=-